MTYSAANDGPRIIPMEAGLEVAVSILSKQLIELHVIWKQYRQLYSDSETIALLNRTAGLFFKIAQDGLWENVLLGICRLLDPVKQGKNINLTFHSLPALISDEGLRVRVTKACADADSAASYASNYRNKWLAHQDHDYATNEATLEKSGVSRQQVENMLAALRDVMQLIDGHYNDADVRYDVATFTGADRLIAGLRRLERLTKAAVENGEGH